MKGKLLKGVVTGIEPYGVFVQFDDYYSGLIHISELSNNYVKDPNDIVHIGDIITAKIIDVDDKLGHLKLSIKNLDYRADSSKTKKNKIVETKHGFSTLDYMLKVWINNKKTSFVLKK